MDTFDQNLNKIQALVDRDIPTVGLQRFFFRELHGYETKMAEFVRALRNRDLDNFTKEMDSWMTMREQELAEALLVSQRREQEREKKRKQDKEMIPSSEILETMTLKELRTLLKKVSLPLHGRKAILIERLCLFRDST